MGRFQTNLYIPKIAYDIKKVFSPIIKKASQVLLVNEFGFKSGSHFLIIRTMIDFIAKKKGLNKTLLIDIMKAYNSVNLDKLKEMIKTKLGTIVCLFPTFVDIYKDLEIILGNKQINPTRGLVEDSFLSLFIF